MRPQPAEGRLPGRTAARLLGGQGRSHQRGATLVEYALVVMIFWVLVFGIIEFGRLVFAYNSVASIAREGARYGIMHPDDSAGVVAAAHSFAPELDLAQLTVDVTWGSGQVNVRTSYPVNLVAGPVIAAIGGVNAVIVRAESTMRLEQ